MDDYNYYTYEPTTTDAGSAGIAALFGGVWMLFWLAVAVLSIIGLWKIFVKAGQEGWKAIIPIYNIYVLTQIVGRPAWWIVGLFIPFVNIVLSLILAIDLAKSFGKDAVFGIVGLFLLQPLGHLYLGFSDAKYVGPAGPEKPATPSKPAASTPAAKS